MNKKKKFLGAFLFLLVFAGAIAIVMLLWNALIPSIIGWSAINYWQAAGLMILCRLLLGGFGRFGKGHFWNRCGQHDHKAFHEMKSRMEGMSRDEKREYIRERMRCGHPFSDGFFGDGCKPQPEDNQE
ncbi:alkaline shock response membrane anchor protein AmaP [Prevotella sp. 10(H)]|uniref:alkaline shock response membrane anchor protein AmaP n=1 Tax=Prevotella sp. 10(H) TaxID=1158294 RepID=UPI00068D835F|nr:alkaline shock response membrane anchor protein AmaP [Prevotella sp. 10(H)]